MTVLGLGSPVVWPSGQRIEGLAKPKGTAPVFGANDYGKQQKSAPPEAVTGTNQSATAP